MTKLITDAMVEKAHSDGRLNNKWPRELTRAVLEAVADDIVETCAKTCLDQVTTAGGMGDATHNRACVECSQAIRALKDKP